MNNPFKVGDLVEVIKPNQNPRYEISAGVPATVTKVSDSLCFLTYKGWATACYTADQLALVLGKDNEMRISSHEVIGMLDI